MSKNKFLVIFATGAIAALVLVFSNFNFSINTGSKKDQATSKTQTEEVDSHHGGGAAVDSSIFNGLLSKNAPDFTLESYDKKKITLSELRGKNVILFFNEGLMCYPACWNQIAAFGKDAKISQKAVVLNITADPVNEWQQAVQKMPELANSIVLFDSRGEVSKKYGVLTLPSSMHKGQFPGHSYVIIDKEGIVKFVMDDIRMAVRNSELEAELEKLK